MNKPHTGSNLKLVRRKNRALVLKQIVTALSGSRTEVALATGLSKMAVGNLVAELIEKNILSEGPCAAGAAPGRPPVALHVSEDAPKLCGMLIKRGLCQVVLTDLQGTILEKETFCYPEVMTAETLIGLLLQGYTSLSERSRASICAIGIASIGPINMKTGRILDPADFYGIRDLDIVDAIKKATSLPVFLTNDANAGALAETLYGLGKQVPSFAYLHIMNGIGAGLTLDGTVHDGDFGQSGEIGHTSINFSGPLCPCGNHGCLDLYANIHSMRQAMQELAKDFPGSSLLAMDAPQWEDFMEAAHAEDPLALRVIDRFCKYLCYAVTNLLGVLDVSTIILGYPAPEGCDIIEQLLGKHLNSSSLHARCRITKIIHSSFQGDAPLVGAAALVADKIFRCELDI